MSAPSRRIAKECGFNSIRHTLPAETGRTSRQSWSSH
jgi:hypothetical protein